MIRHIVLFTARREQDLQVIHDGLSLLKDIPDCPAVPGQFMPHLQYEDVMV